MKNKILKTSALILAAVLIFALAGCQNKQPIVTPDTPEEEKPLIYKHVAIIGVDGAGNFFNKTDTPNMDRIFANGATSFTASAEIPTISAQNWGSMLYGIACDVHGFTNDIIENGSKGYSTPYSSVFKLLRQNDHDAVLCSVVNWKPINLGLIEWDINVIKDSVEDDAIVTQKAKQLIMECCPELLFVQFDGVDGEGHSNGYGSQVYLDYISVIDGYIGQLYEAYDDIGILDETLFIVVSDHGGTFVVDENGNGSGGHGGSTPEEVTVFLGVTGKTVANIDLGAVRNRDVTAITAAALGIEIPETWTSTVPEGLFTDR